MKSIDIHKSSLQQQQPKNKLSQPGKPDAEDHLETPPFYLQQND